MKVPRSVWLPAVASLAFSATVYLWGVSSDGAPGWLSLVWPLLSPGFLLQLLLGGGHGGFGGWREPVIVIGGAGLCWTVVTVLLIRLIVHFRHEKLNGRGDR